MLTINSLCDLNVFCLSGTGGQFTDEVAVDHICRKYLYPYNRYFIDRDNRYLSIIYLSCQHKKCLNL